MTDTIDEIQNEIIEEFSKLHDWFEKYEYIINLGNNLETMDETIKNEETSINGCQSQVWLKAELKNDTMRYVADSDSLIVKGMISLLLRTLNNQHPKDIANSHLYFIDTIGLSSNLSPSRSNGLITIIKKIKSYAENYTVCGC